MPPHPDTPRHLPPQPTDDAPLPAPTPPPGPAPGQTVGPPGSSPAPDPDPLAPPVSSPTVGRDGGRRRRVVLLSVVAVLLALVLTLACGGWWFLREMDRYLEDPGAESPEFAALTWLYALRGDAGAWSGPHVDADARAAVTAVRASTVRALRVNRATLDPGTVPPRQGAVSAGEVVEWWYVSSGAGATSRDGARPWRFTTVARGGQWWITAVHAPPMCGRGGYFRTCP